MTTKHPSTPEVRKLLTDMIAQSRREDPGTLMAAIYRYLFGEPMVARSVVSYWFGLLESRIALFGDFDTQSTPEKTIATLLTYLSEAPAAPCLRSHQVGEDQHHLVYFMPFGSEKTKHAIGGDTSSPQPLSSASASGNVVQPRNLIIPIIHADPRIIHALNIIVMDHGAFTHSEEDPVHQYTTLSCFSYTKAAGQALEKYRAVFVATAIRTLMENIRAAIQHSARANQHDFPELVPIPTYLQAKREATLINRVLDEINKVQNAQNASPSSRRLLDACFKYVVIDQPRKWSKPDATKIRLDQPRLTAEQIRMFSHPYGVLPTDEMLKNKFLRG